ncbi:MAG: Trm112 family protein [Verrucomicrobiota bacterium]
MISEKLLEIVACPACEDRPPLTISDDEKFLVCSECGRKYPIRDGIPVLLVDEAITSESV